MYGIQDISHSIKDIVIVKATGESYIMITDQPS